MEDKCLSITVGKLAKEVGIIGVRDQWYPSPTQKCLWRKASPNWYYWKTRKISQELLQKTWGSWVYNPGQIVKISKIEIDVCNQW